MIIALFKNDDSPSAAGRLLAQTIFAPLALIATGAVIICGLVAALAINSAVTKAFQRQLQATQALFVDSVRQDLLSGANAEVYRKCKNLLKDETVLAVSIVGPDGINVCELQDSKLGSLVESTIFYDEEKTKKAGLVKVSYSDSFMEVLLARSAALIACTLLALMVGLFFFSRRISLRLSQPISSLAEKFSSKSLEDFSKIGDELPLSKITELNLLSHGINQLAVRLQKYEVELVEKTREAASARMVEMLAHDVRKPFSILRMGMGMLSGASDVAGLKKILSRLLPEIDKAVSSVDGLIADVLEVGSTSTQLIQEPASPEMLIEATLGEVFRVYPNADIAISYDLQHSQSINVHVQKVGRVFSNIVGNAVQAMGKKGSIWFRTRDRDGFIEFCLGNAGSLISPESLPRLFDAFFTSGKKGGTGLGLAIAEKVVKAHGGKIWCESSKTLEHPDGKVEFFFTLPVAPGYPSRTMARLPMHSIEITMTLLALAEASKQSEGSVDKGELTLEHDILQAHVKLGRKIRVLLIDDEAVYRQALVAYLSRTPELAQTMQFVQAEGSNAALQSLNAEPFDLVITDVDMGSDSLDGFELVHAMRARSVAALVCVHSNRIVAADHKAAISAGADAFLPKPVARAQLLKLVLQATAAAEVQHPSPALLRQDAVVAGNLRPEVLICDDNPFVLDAWENKLKADAAVHLFSSFETLIERVETDPTFVGRLALAVTDMNLDGSGGDGIDVGRLLKRYSPRLRVLLSSDGAIPNSKLEGAIDLAIGKDPVGLAALSSLLDDPLSVNPNPGCPIDAKIRIGVESTYRP